MIALLEPWPGIVAYIHLSTEHCQWTVAVDAMFADIVGWSNWCNILTSRSCLSSFQKICSRCLRDGTIVLFKPLAFKSCWNRLKSFQSAHNIRKYAAKFWAIESWRCPCFARPFGTENLHFLQKQPYKVSHCGPLLNKARVVVEPLVTVHKNRQPRCLSYVQILPCLAGRVVLLAWALLQLFVGHCACVLHKVRVVFELSNHHPTQCELGCLQCLPSAPFSCQGWRVWRSHPVRSCISSTCVSPVRHLKDYLRFPMALSNSDSDSDHMLQTQLGQSIYAICDMKHGMRALLQGGALASRDVMPSSFYWTVPKSCSHWSSLLLGATLEHTKILWTLCPTKTMAFCRIGPSNQISDILLQFTNTTRGIWAV